MPAYVVHLATGQRVRCLIPRAPSAAEQDALTAEIDQALAGLRDASPEAAERAVRATLERHQAAMYERRRG